MLKNQINKLRSYLATEAVVDDNEAASQTLPASAEGVAEFKVIIPQINDLAQAQISRGGFSSQKAYAFESMGNAAYEIAAAVLAYTDKEGQLELAGRVEFSRSAITDVRESVAVARCRDILAAATANVDALADYGVKQAKLNALKNKIDGFEAVQPAPRKQVVQSSSATKTLKALFLAADTLLTRRLDGLAVQFKTSAPDFYNQYVAARSIIDTAGTRKAKTPVTPAAGGDSAPAKNS